MSDKIKIPKRAFTKPRVDTIVFFIIISLFIVVNFAPIGWQFLVGIFAILILIVPGWFCSYYTGLSLAKVNYKKIKQKKMLQVVFQLLNIQLIMIAVCVLIEVKLVGYPLKSCIDFCGEVELMSVISFYAVSSTIIFLPAYYAIYRYSVWVIKYNIRKFDKEDNVKKVLIATTNPGKVMTAKKILARLGYEGLSFADLGLDLEEPEETKLTAEEIAAEKALGYAKQFKDFPVLARDDTNVLVGVDEEDDPKNHNKEFVARKAGKYSDENGERVFADIAHKYGGELPTRFDWGYAVAWHDGDEIKVVSALATTGTERTKIVDEISPNKVPGFCFAPILKVLIDGKWKYDSELTEDESWKAYWNTQAETIKSLLEKCESNTV